MTTAAVIVAGGSGLRAGGEIPKQYQMLAGAPVLRRTIEAFLRHPGIGGVQVVIGEDHERLYREAVEGLDLPDPVTGGSTRQASVWNGLAALATDPPDLVLIHDAARPFIDRSLISHVIAWLDRHPAVLPALAVADTLKRANANIVMATVDRTGLWAAQTPQGFRYHLIAAAHRLAAQTAGIAFTDDASIAEWAGIEVAIIPGSHDNRKITTADDLRDADRRLQMEQWLALPDVRVGQGFDVHAFEPGDHVMMGGVRIAHERGLAGHSDADVAMHALTDAILGTLSAGDIGKHFPPSDPQWKGADSGVFLKAAAAMVLDRGGRITHGDITIVCERPRIGPHVDAMRARLASLLGIEETRISVKATTSERLGFTGREEGIAAFATATVRLPA